MLGMTGAFAVKRGKQKAISVLFIQGKYFNIFME